MSKQSAIERTARAAAQFGDAADVVRHATAVALGVNRTDFRVLSALHFASPVSAGALAAEVGLSPAALTDATRRLVAKGLLTRDTDPSDRRRAAIAISPAAAAALTELTRPVRGLGRELLDSYTLAELELIATFLERGRELQLTGADQIRAAPVN